MANATEFNPDDVGQRNGLFGGLPLTPEEAKVVVLPVPWDVTVSSGEGTAEGPMAILAASPQLDFYDERIAQAWKLAPAYGHFPGTFLMTNPDLRESARAYIAWLENGQPEAERQAMQETLETINECCEEMNALVEREATAWLEKGKIVGVVGGDHSTPLGLIRALAKKHGSFGILHIDAHLDLRQAYEGFTYSHASIMYNALKEPAVSRLVQVGVRDFCEAEVAIGKGSEGRIKIFTGRKLQRHRAMGLSWSTQTERILESLPGDVYVSFDIDGLEPWLCPNTGTPVPGGLDFEQVFYILEALVERGHRIIGFDLTEVAPGGNGWDAAVGARALYRLSTLAAASWGHARMREL